MSGDYAWGFRWGPMTVTRLMVYRDRSWLLGIKTAYHDVEIRVSRTGRSVRVFKDGVELS